MVKMKRTGLLLMGMLVMLSMVGLRVNAGEKQTIYNSPYVTFSPDGQAWTTNAGDADYSWYEKGTKVSTGLTSTLRALKTGEHYYKIQRQGEIPVGRWEVAYRTGTCIHSGYPDEADNFHGIKYGRSKCRNYYYSGWFAYCADCGEKVKNMYVYMSKEAAKSIDYLQLSDTNVYYYLCPHCTNLEQGAAFNAHECKTISYNQYKVRYNANASSYGGYMEDSIHMYNNATTYEGESVNASKTLTKNTYSRIGYEFAGWNTKADGTGKSYADGAEVYNLSNKDWRVENGKKGVITLYAQWKPSKSTLCIDPAGGSFDGKTGITNVVKTYGSKYDAAGSMIKPPSGYTVTFESNGGNKVKAITGTLKFKEWLQGTDFQGRMQGTTYYFVGTNGNTDIITASYTRNAITLPSATRNGYSFGGWYGDKKLTDFVGGAGTKIIPGKNMKLYALWVDLKLEAENNMTANDGKGAVDLSWEQQDSKNKTYLLYQSRDKEEWVQIHSANNLSNEYAVEESFVYTGAKKTYTVPYSGVYKLSVKGAQGGNYKDYTGGLGGSVTAKVWLEKGEVLTYNVGGQNGYNGGGKGDTFASGGGCTSVSSNKKGTLLIAGGGGGASSVGNGGAGGSSTSVLATGTTGESGKAGGGGGYKGGKAGELIVHKHAESCYHYDYLDYTLLETSGTNIVDSPSYKWNDWMQKFSTAYKVFATSDSNCYAVTTSLTKMMAHTKTETQESFIAMQFGRVANADAKAEDSSTWYIAPSFSPEYIPTNGNTQVLIDVLLDGCHDEGTENINTEKTYLYVYDQDGNCIFSKNAKQVTNKITYGDAVNLDTAQTGILIENDNVQAVRFVEKIDLPEGTKGIYFETSLRQTGGAWLKLNVNKVIFSGGKTSTVICGYKEGQVISSKPPYGGSNYINDEYISDYSDEAGKKQKDGSFTITSEIIGFLDAQKLNNVIATDYAKPGAVSADSVQREAAGTNKVKVSWKKPKDNGTMYYHQAESYVKGGETPDCVSNTTENELISGIAGYYYLVNTSASTNITKKNGTFVKVENVTVTLSDKKKYLHVAAVDVAGNLGSTTHFGIGSKDTTVGRVEWDIETKQLTIAKGDNVYKSDEEKTYYVRSDGETPITLGYQAALTGPASVNYQPNYIVYETVCDNVTSKNSFYLAVDSIKEGSIKITEEKLEYSVTGNSLLTRYPYSEVKRSDYNKRISAVQKFTMSESASGKEIMLYPRAGADSKNGIKYSLLSADKEKGLRLIGDGEAPTITGLDLLENKALINRKDGNIVLNAQAKDALSGLKEFYITITNLDNAIEKKYTSDTKGKIKIKITADEPIFSGDFMVEAYAVDNVGNEYGISYSTTEFALEASLKRLRETQDGNAAIFKCGESGLLTISTWGYAERVEVVFPEAMTKLNPELNRTYVYTNSPQYKQVETLQFMIPLYTPANENYTIIVRACKGDKKLEKYPALCTIEVEGDVLEELRTRLR